MKRLGAFWLTLLIFLSGPALVGKVSFGDFTIAAENVGANSAAQAARLRTQLAAEEIAGGHAYGKHVVQRGEFPGVTSPK